MVMSDIPLPVEKFEKLPKYAQDAFAQVQMKIRELRQQVRALQGEQVTDTYIQLGDVTQYLDGHYGIVFRLDSAEKDFPNEIRVSIDRHHVAGKRLQIMAVGYPSTLHIAPQAGNVVNITTARY